MCELEFNESIKRFALLKTAEKITFEFYVNTKEKDKFLYWIKVLSSVEFGVTVDLNGINTKEYKLNNKIFNRALKYDTNDKVVFRVKVSGTKENLNRWNDNLCVIAKFLRDDYDITYLKTIDEQKN